MDKNDFKFTIPADLEKSTDGEWRVRGLASTENIDQQGETIIQKGIDLTPIDQLKGVLNWDHAKGPENTIGLLDGYTKTGDGLYVEGRLFKNHAKAKAVKEIMESLGKGDRGRIGLSLEGRILERDAGNPAIIKKCQINAVALTMNPINASTYADLVKSFNASEVEFNSEESTVLETPLVEPTTYTADQVAELVTKALAISANAGSTPPCDLAGGDALAKEDFKDSKKKKKVKKMSYNMYKSGLISILDKLQTLFPNNSRSEIWEAVKDRLQTKFPI